MKQVVLNARKLFANSGGVYIALAVLLAVCSVSNEYFRNPQNLANITRQVSYSGIIALGMTFVIAAGGIDLAVGSLFALAGVVSLFAMNSAGGSEAVQLAAGFGAALGVAPDMSAPREIVEPRIYVAGKAPVQQAMIDVLEALGHEGAIAVPRELSARMGVTGAAEIGL